jgi:hypothetical protein
VTAPFVQSVRARREAIRVNGVDGARARQLSLRVEVPEIWDVVQVLAPDSTPVLTVKESVLRQLIPGANELHYVMKLRGWEVLDEGQSLAGVGAIDGSIFLLTHRRRRPVR